MLFRSAWIQFNAVDFGKKSYKSVVVKAISKTGGSIQVHLNSTNGPIIAIVNVPKGDDWQTVKVSGSKLKPGVQNLVLSASNNNPVEVDWISFE